MSEVKRYWVHNDDLHTTRGRDNPREVLLAHDYDLRAPSSPAGADAVGLVRELRQALATLADHRRQDGHPAYSLIDPLLARADKALADGVLPEKPQEGKP